MKKTLCIMLLLFSLATIAVAQTGPVDRIQRGSGAGRGRVIVNSDGSVTVTNPTGTVTTFSGPIVLGPFLFAGLPSGSLGMVATASDCLTPACTAGGGSIKALVVHNGTSWVGVGGGGDALTTNPLSQFAATTSAQLAGVMSDETGSGSAVFGTSPTLTTPVINSPTGIVKGDVGLGNVDDTSDANKPVSTAQQTALNLKQNTITFGANVQAALANAIGSAGAPVLNGGVLGSPSSAGTIPAFTLGGTIAGGGNQLNNIIIGTSTPLAGFFTTLSATGYRVNGGATSGNYLRGNGTDFISSAIQNGDFGTAMTPQFARLGLGAAADATALILGDGTYNFSGSSTLAHASYILPLQVGGNGMVLATKARAASSGINFTANAYLDAVGWKYISTDEAAIYAQAEGIHTWYTAPSGTAGTAITLTSRFAITQPGAVTWSSGITDASGTPGSLCYNTSTYEMLKNNALTCTVSSRDYKIGILPLFDINRFRIFGGGGSSSAFDKLRPVQFAYKDAPKRPRWGFIAEEAAEADPRFADGYDAQGIPRSLDQNAILAATVKELQELKATVREQHVEIQSLRRLSGVKQ